MNIKEKYLAHRDKITNGSIILFKSDKKIGKIISKADGNVFATHVGIIFKVHGRLLLIDSTEFGVKPRFLSHGLKRYSDFKIIEPTANMKSRNTALEETFIQAENKKIRYDYIRGLRWFLKRWIKVDFEFLGSDTNDLCHEWVKRYTNALTIKEYEKVDSPQDFLRFINPKNCILKF